MEVGSVPDSHFTDVEVEVQLGAPSISGGSSESSLSSCTSTNRVEVFEDLVQAPKT